MRESEQARHAVRESERQREADQFSAVSLWESTKGKRQLCCGRGECLCLAAGLFVTSNRLLGALRENDFLSAGL